MSNVYTDSGTAVYSCAHPKGKASKLPPRSLSLSWGAGYPAVAQVPVCPDCGLSMVLDTGTDPTKAGSVSPDRYHAGKLQADVAAAVAKIQAVQTAAAHEAAVLAAVEAQLSVAPPLPGTVPPPLPKGVTK